MSDQPQSEATPATNAPTSPNGNLASAAQPPMTVSSAAQGTARRIVLGAREEATAAELSLLDPQLASLFRIGHDAARSEEPAAVYMIAHAGRELARGVVSARTTPGAPATVFTMDACAPDGERNRATIAEVLQTQPNHAVVSEWFRLNKLFSDSVHYRDPAPESLRVRSAYLEFSDLLFGRVAPYFTTHAELERLIAREAPDGDDMNSVRTLLTRHVQRQHFFTALSSAGWLDPLAAAGFFDAPPDVVLDQEGREFTQPWPEGQYLVRMAPIQPARVAELLRGVPSTNRNVTVWRTMPEAALAMPPESARTLVRLLSRALANTARPQFLSHTLVDLTTRLGVLGEPGAFELADALLWTANAPLDTVEGSSGPAGRAFGASRSTEWMLERIEVYDLERLCDDAVPAMMEQSPKRTLRLLTRKLERTMRLAEDTNTLARAADSSSRWCPDFTDRSHSSDVRTILAVALNAVAVSASSEDSTAVWAELKDHGSDIFDRIRLNVLGSV